jgi:hypothetical protein
MTLGRGIARSLLVAIILVLASGCAAVPTGRFDALALATREVDTRTGEVDGDVVQITRRFMIFSPAPGPYTPRSFAPVVTVGGQQADFDFGPRLAPRKAALDVLVAYTEALSAFAKKDYQGNLDKATNTLGGNLQDLISHASASNDVKRGAGVLAAVVNELGRAAIDRMRKTALRNAMAEAAPGVSEIAKFVRDINERAALAVTVMRDEMLRIANRANPVDGAARLALSETVEQVIVDSASVLARLKQSTVAVEAIPAAHDEVRDSLDRDERGALDKLKALIAEAKRLQHIYSSLK